MRGKNHSIISMLMLFALIASLFTGCGGGTQETPVITMPDEAALSAVFNKTIHDFGDLRVDNLDERENNNFIVYAESVQEITMSETVNVLVETDYEKLTYTFSHADDALKSMKKGDVFFAPASDYAPEGVTAKVKKIRVSGDTVTVTSEQVGLADFFEYLDFSLVIPLRMEEEQAVASVSSGSGQSSSASDPVKLPLEYPFDFSLGNAKVSGELHADLLVHADVLFDRKTMQFFCSVYTDTDFDHTFNLSYGGQLLDKEFKGKTLPARLGGFCTLALETKLTLDMSGEIKGNLHYTSSDRYGFMAYASSAGGAFEPYHFNIKPGVGEGSLGNMEVDMNVGLELKPVLGFGFIGNVFASVNGGVNIHGESTPIVETPPQDAAESIHACDFCIDGEVNTSARISCGMEITLFSSLIDLFVDEEDKSELEELYDSIFCPEKELYSGNWKVTDFYISKRGEQTDYDWTECPHYMYRTTVTVTKEDGTPGAGAEVTCEGAYESAVTDKGGQAVIYLPVGEHTVEARTDDEDGSAPVTVKEEPARCQIGMGPTLYEVVTHLSNPMAYIDLNNRTYNPYYYDKDPYEGDNWIRKYDSKGILREEIWERTYSEYLGETFPPRLSFGWYGTYDASGTLIKEEIKGENTENWYYDPATNTYYNSVEIGILKYVYNDAGQLMEQSRTYTDGTAEGEEAKYDAAGNLIWYRRYDTEFTELVETFVYDENNRVVQDNEDLWVFGKTRTLTEYRNTYDGQGNHIRVDFTIDTINYESNYQYSSWGYFVYTYDAAGQYKQTHYYHVYGDGGPGEVAEYIGYDPGFGCYGICAG